MFAWLSALLRRMQESERAAAAGLRSLANMGNGIRDDINQGPRNDELSGAGTARAQITRAANGMDLHLSTKQIAALWAAITLGFGGNALYTHTRPPPGFTEPERAELMEQIGVLQGQVKTLQQTGSEPVRLLTGQAASIAASVTILADQAIKLADNTHELTRQVEALEHTGPTGVIDRLDQLQRQLNRCDK